MSRDCWWCLRVCGCRLLDMVKGRAFGAGNEGRGVEAFGDASFCADSDCYGRVLHIKGARNERVGVRAVLADLVKRGHDRRKEVAAQRRADGGGGSAASGAVGGGGGGAQEREESFLPLAIYADQHGPAHSYLKTDEFCTDAVFLGVRSPPLPLFMTLA